MLPTGKENISFSELYLWDECSWRHKLKYIEKVAYDDPEGPELVFGKCMHSLCETYLRDKRIDIETCLAKLASEWNERSFDKLKLTGYILAAEGIASELHEFMDTAFAGWEYVAAEEELYEPIASTDAKFKGFIDCVIRLKKGKKVIHWIIDWKTTSYGWSPQKKQDPRRHLQLALYKHFWSIKHNIPLTDIRCGFVLLKRTAKPGKRCELVTVSVGPTSAKRADKKVTNMLSAMQKKMYMKNRNSCLYCPYANTEHCT
jgi:hypothetical protein